MDSVPANTVRISTQDVPTDRDHNHALISHNRLIMDNHNNNNDHQANDNNLNPINQNPNAIVPGNLNAEREDVWFFVAFLHYFYYLYDSVKIRYGDKTVYVAYDVWTLFGLLGTFLLNIFTAPFITCNKNEMLTLVFDIIVLFALIGILIAFIVISLKNLHISSIFIMLYISVSLAHFSLDLSLMSTIGSCSDLFYYFTLTLFSINGSIIVAFAYVAIFVFAVCIFIFEFLFKIVTCNFSDPFKGIYYTRHNFLVRVSDKIQIGPGREYDKLKFKQTKCSICLSDLMDGQLVCQLICHVTHVFHKLCLDQWVKVEALFL